MTVLPEELREAEHEGERCHDCGRPYDLVWIAPHALWNRIWGDEGGLLCPDCFHVRCKRAGESVYFYAFPPLSPVEFDAITTSLAHLSRQHELLREAEEAMAQADREASIAHDAIWAEEVASAGVLHDNEREDSAQAAIWRLHDVLRSWIARYHEQEEGR